MRIPVARAEANLAHAISYLRAAAEELAQVEGPLWDSEASLLAARLKTLDARVGGVQAHLPQPPSIPYVSEPGRPRLPSDH